MSSEALKMTERMGNQPLKMTDAGKVKRDKKQQQQQQQQNKPM